MIATRSADRAQSTTASKPCTYKHVELIRVYNKAGELLGYAAKPEKLFEYGNLGLPNTYYHITREESNGFVWWRCTCKGSAVYGKRCKHIKAAMILCGELVEAEEIAPVVEEKQDGDMSIQEHFIEEELRVYQHDLQEWGIDALRQNIKVNGLSVASRSKEPLIVALVQHRRQALLANVPSVSPLVPTSDIDMSTNCQAAQPKISTIKVAIIARMQDAPLNGNRAFSILR